jgi:hypothetical protein
MSYTDPIWAEVIAAVFAAIAFVIAAEHLWSARHQRREYVRRETQRITEEATSLVDKYEFKCLPPGVDSSRAPVRTWHDGEWVDNARS